MRRISQPWIGGRSRNVIEINGKQETALDVHRVVAMCKSIPAFAVEKYPINRSIHLHTHTHTLDHAGWLIDETDFFGHRRSADHRRPPAQSPPSSSSLTTPQCDYYRTTTLAEEPVGPGGGGGGGRGGGSGRGQATEPPPPSGCRSSEYGTKKKIGKK